MRQVTAVICFGYAINQHLIPDDQQDSPRPDYLPIEPVASDVAQTVLCAYMQVRREWNVVVSDRLDALVGTTIVTTSSRSSRRKRSGGGDL